VVQRRRALASRSCAAAATHSRDTLAELDSLLQRAASDGDDARPSEAQAVALARAQLPRFATGERLPRRDYSLAELRLNKIEAEKLLSPRDSTLESVRGGALAATSLALAAWAYLGQPDTSALVSGGLAVALAATVDQVGLNGSGGALLLDALGRAMSDAYRQRVLRHESSHFLVAYLMGVLPLSYTLSTWQALRQGGKGSIAQAGCRFCDAAFAEEVQAGAISASSLDAFACVALAGVAAEYEAFGAAEGGINDVRQLDALLNALAFTQKRADSCIRSALLTVVYLLRRHTQAHDALAAAMARGASVASCCAVIEEALA
jgi:hypothetical protein